MKRTLLVLCLLLAVATAFGVVTTAFGQVRPPNTVIAAWRQAVGAQMMTAK